MPFIYQTGEQVMIGDRVLYAGEPSEVVDIGDPDQNPEYWIVTEHGGGVMIDEVKPKDQPKVFGAVLLQDTQNAEDLELVSRGPNPRSFLFSK